MYGLSPRGRKQDKHASQHQPSTAQTSSRTMTRSKSKGFKCLKPFAGMLGVLTQKAL